MKEDNKETRVKSPDYQRTAQRSSAAAVYIYSNCGRLLIVVSARNLTSAVGGLVGGQW